MNNHGALHVQRAILIRPAGTQYPPPRFAAAVYFIILFSFSMHSGHTYLPPKETMCLTLPQNTQAS